MSKEKPPNQSIILKSSRSKGKFLNTISIEAKFFTYRCINCLETEIRNKLNCLRNTITNKIAVTLVNLSLLVLMFTQSTILIIKLARIFCIV